MNKKELENEIIKTQEQLKKLQAALDEAEKLEKEVPEKLIIGEGDGYFYVNDAGDICWAIYTGISPTNIDIRRVSKRRAFLVRRQAEMFANKTQFIADMLHFKYLYDMDYEPNWDSRDETKYCVYYNYYAKKFECGCRDTFAVFESVYFSTVELASRCAEWLNKKLYLRDIGFIKSCN